MFTDKPEPSIAAPLPRRLPPLLLVGALLLAGCDSSETSAEGTIADVVIAPDSVSLAVGEQVEFSAVALTASGDTVRDPHFEWQSTDPAVFTVTDDGVATGHAPGTAFCGVGVSDEGAGGAARFVPIGLDSALVRIL